MKVSLAQLLEFLGNNQAAWIGVVVFSAISFVATLLIIPWLVLRMPQDYFAGEKPQKPLWLKLHPLLRIVLHILKNLLGLALVLIGIALLFLPGQGVLTIVFGFLLLDFPGRYRVTRWLVQRPSVLKSINWLRRRYHRPPLRFEM